MALFSFLRRKTKNATHMVKVTVPVLENFKTNRNPAQIGQPILEYLGLKDWFSTLDKSVQKKIKKYMNEENDTLILESKDTPLSFHGRIIYNALERKDFTFARLYCSSLLNNIDNPFEKHVLLESVHSSFFYWRKTFSYSLDFCLELCEQDVALVQENRDYILDCCINQ